MGTYVIITTASETQAISCTSVLSGSAALKMGIHSQLVFILHVINPVERRSDSKGV
jgi:hypothetical protein